MSSNKWIVKLLGAVIALLVVSAVVIGARTAVGGNLTRAREIAFRLQADAIANPNPVASSASATTQPGANPTVAAAPTVVVSASAAKGVTAAAPAKASAQSNNKVATTAPSSSSASSSTTVKTSGGAAVAPAPTSRPVVVSTVAPRRQPTADEVALAISAVHSLVPFFTPTASDIANAGDQVCTALDQGQPYSQVQSHALDMVGASSYSWAIPSSVPDIAIRTLVALYCPGNASKLP